MVISAAGGWDFSPIVVCVSLRRLRYGPALSVKRAAAIQPLPAGGLLWRQERREARGMLLKQEIRPGTIWA